MVPEVQPVTLEEFRITPSFADGSLVLHFSGIGDITAANPLAECLTAVRDGIVSGDITSVEFDIRRLELLNSSCLKAFATFVIELVSRKSSCPVRFIVGAKIPWQARSLFALERLARSFVTIVPR